MARSRLPTELFGLPGFTHRLYERGGEPEIVFFYRDREPILPVWTDGRLILARWGNGRGQSRFLPRTGWTWNSTLQEGRWREREPLPVDIPANFALDGGVWYHVRQGLRGILVHDEREEAVIYILCEPASHYYKIMTRRDRMPLFIQEQI